jgi:hypothetical protein
VVLFNSEGLPIDTFHASAAAVRTAIQQHASAPASPAAAPAATGAGPAPQALLAEAPPTSSSTSSHKPGGAVCTTPEIPCGLLPGGSSDGSMSVTATSSSSPASTARHSTPATDLEAAKAAFLQASGPAYGYGGWLDAQYEREVGSRLGPGQHYLDYTGEHSGDTDSCKAAAVGSP